MLNPPEIPGFIFDSERKKYFKITNGDQRHNSNYTNNAVRGKVRRKRLDQIRSPKKFKESSSLTEISRDFQKQWQEPGNFMVNVRLGLSQPTTFERTLSKIRASIGARKIGQFSVWKFANSLFWLKVLRSRILTIHQDLFSAINSSNTAISAIRIPSTEIRELQSKENWIWISFSNGEYCLVRFSNESLALLDVTATLRACLNQNGVASDTSIEDAFYLKGKFLSTNELLLISSSCLGVVIELENVVCRASIRLPSTQSDGMFKIAWFNQFLCYQNGLSIFIIDFAGNLHEEMRFKRNVITFFIDDFHTASDPLARFTIVTRDAVLARDFQLTTKKLSKLSIIAKRFDDNIAHPVVMRFDSHLLVQSSPAVYLSVEINKKLASYVELPVLDTRSFASLPRFLMENGNVLISCNGLTHILTTTML